jgi:hypothetical protein
MKSGELENILTQLKELFNLSQDQEVARLLGISRASLANHKTRKTIPYKEIIAVLKKNKKNVNDVFSTNPRGIEVTVGKPLKEEEEQVLKDLIKAQQKIIELQDENKDLRELLSKVPPRSRKKSGNGA